MKCENGDLRTQLENSKKQKERNTSRRMAWLITNQSLRSRYEQEKAEQEAKKQEQEQRRQEKEAWDIEEAAYIAREAADRVFGSFASYKVKCDLIILARALRLSAEGTNSPYQRPFTGKRAKSECTRQSFRRPIPFWQGSSTSGVLPGTTAHQYPCC